MNPFLRSWCLAAAMAAAACPARCFAQQEAGVRVAATLRGDAVATGRNVKLGEIAVLPGSASALAQVVLTEAPQPGTPLHLSRREVLRLLHEAGVQYLALDGADSVTVETAAQLLDGERLVAAAGEALTAALQRDGLTLRLTPEDLHEARLPQGTVSLRVRQIPPARPRSRMTVWVDVALDGALYRAVPVSFRVSAIGNVLVARTGLAKGAQPDCAVLAVEERDVTALPAAPQEGGCAALGRRLRRGMAAGEALLADELEEVPAVSEGEYVKLEVVNGAVKLEARALALTDGNIGQRIPVRASSGDEPVLATVVAPGVVNLNGR
jgi:flagella basal body P-ring formation protein FlgA